MLRFPFLAEPLSGNPPPSLSPGATARWRPLIPVHIIGPTGLFRFFRRTLLDTGADDTIFPLDLTLYIGVTTKTFAHHGIRWRGQSYPLHFGDVEIELSDESGAIWRWPTTIGFSAAPIRYPILGQAGFLCYCNAVFLGDQRGVELETNSSFPGSKK